MNQLLHNDNIRKTIISEAKGDIIFANLAFFNIAYSLAILSSIVANIVVN